MILLKRNNKKNKCAAARAASQLKIMLNDTENEVQLPIMFLTNLPAMQI